MSEPRQPPASYKCDDWIDIEHCVYDALMDAPENLQTHRVAHVVSRLVAELIRRDVFTQSEIESFLRSCRG